MNASRFAMLINDNMLVMPSWFYSANATPIHDESQRDAILSAIPHIMEMGKLLTETITSDQRFIDAVGEEKAKECEFLLINYYTDAVGGDCIGDNDGEDESDDVFNVALVMEYRGEMTSFRMLYSDFSNNVDEKYYDPTHSFDHIMTLGGYTHFVKALESLEHGALNPKTLKSFVESPLDDGDAPLEHIVMDILSDRDLVVAK